MCNVIVERCCVIEIKIEILGIQAAAGSWCNHIFFRDTVCLQIVDELLTDA